MTNDGLSMTGWLERHQVPLYLGAMGVGAIVGLTVPGPASAADVTITPLLAVLLYVTFLQVPLASMARSARGGRFLGALIVLNFAIVPLVVAAMLPCLPDNLDLRLGVLLVLLCPCVDYVITFSGLGGGNSARLLAATPLLLGIQVLVLPILLRMFLGEAIAEVVDISPFLTAFATLIVAPLGLAWLTQTMARRYAAMRSFRDGMSALMVPIMMAVLGVVVASQLPMVGDHLGDIAAVIPFYVIYLVVMAPIGVLVARAARLDQPDEIAVTFSGATRNSLVVLPLALALPAPVPLAAAAVVTQTLVEVVGMVIYVRVIKRLSACGRGSR